MIPVTVGPESCPAGPGGLYSPQVILTVIEHMSTCPLDRLGPWLVDAAGPGLTLQVVRPWAGDAVPDTAAECGDGLVVLGGQGHAYDDEGSPWLPATRDLLADAVRTGLPTLGICLGAQLLAVATGGRVQVAAPPGRESGIVHVNPRPEAAEDALLGRLASQVPADHPLTGGVLVSMPTMHADAVVDLPADAVWLASSRLYPYQAFRAGRGAWGLQFHPEASLETFAAWADLHDDVDTDDVVAQYRAHSAEIAQGGREIARAFVEVVAGQPATRSSASMIR